MVRPTRFELVTLGFGGRYSNPTELRARCSKILQYDVIARCKLTIVNHGALDKYRSYLQQICRPPSLANKRLKANIRPHI